MKPYKQGIFNPIYPQKYKGTMPIIYRSGLELKAMRWLDSNDKVMYWGSESISIPYQKPNIKTGKVTNHRYYPDFNVSFKTDKGFQNYLIEVKPYRQTMPPSSHGNKKQSTIIYEQNAWVTNTCKWNYARDWCNKNNYKFLIITEKHLPNV